MTARIINYCEKNKVMLKDIKLKDLTKIDQKITKNIYKIFDVYNSVDSKKSFGGTSFDNIKKMIKTYKRELK